MNEFTGYIIEKDLDDFINSLNYDKKLDDLIELYWTIGIKEFV